MGLSSRLVLLLAVACGATVANMYYAQPLLDTIAHALNVSSGTAGLLVVEWVVEAAHCGVLRNWAESAIIAFVPIPARYRAG